MNEGDNLHRQKVQRITGGQPATGPAVQVELAELGPNPGEEAPVTPTESSDLPSSHEHTTDRDSASQELELIQNDFGVQDGFDSDLEYGTLPESPLGCSTPRLLVGAVCDSVSIGSLQHSPTMSVSAEWGSTPTSVSRLAINAGYLRKRHPNPGPPAEAPGMLKVSGTYTGKHLSPKPVLAPVQQKRAKKHPSPSKEMLENMEIALHKVARLKVMDARAYEVNELCGTQGQTEGLLKARDPNRLVIRSHAGTTAAGSCSSGIGDNGHYTAADTSTSRLPRPAQAQRRRLSRAGPMMVRRPVMVGADDTDELQ